MSISGVAFHHNEELGNWVNSGDKMIVTEKLGKQFDDFVAVHDVSLQVRAGQILALLGPNGAGKTTTVRMLTSVLPPTRGRAWVAGYDVVQEPFHVRRSVGVLTENHGLYERMPAGDYLEFFGKIYGLERENLQRRIAALMERFGLQDVLDRRIGTFSKGMRQKLALARSMLHEPPVLLLDEPTSAMDPESARLVRDSIHELRSAQRAILICTHNLAEAEELADEIAIISRGKIIVHGSPAALKLSLLGEPEYEACLGTTLNGHDLELPPGAKITASGPNSLRYRTATPQVVNPQILQILFERGLPVISLQEVPRSLEQVYLHAVGNAKHAEVKHASQP
jgi:ABC-2 type transport system ATP-binding protein